ncbi:bifunctional metallophosphatase/5'-nucleotidase [Kytococcus sedentarius]|uniref:bifunctional metallophosphatase/5'-nucleotidase n=1 Tax=Kytococcus sedentarius TaxID=1276 RepID=UPI0035BBA0F1
MFRRTAPVGLSAVLLVALSPTVTAQAAPGEVELQILSFNDFHGNIEAPDDPSEPGGAANLAAHLDRLRSEASHSATVVGGDSIGASPFLSAAFRDEPTIDALSAMDLTAVAVGNHEFDQGTDELLRMDAGGCLDDGDGEGGRNSCPIPGKTFTGAAFPFLAANVLWKDSGEPMLPSYVIEEYDGVKVAYVGLGLDETPDIVSAAGIQDVDFVDAASRANELVPELKAQGVEAMVAVIHEGGTSENGTDVSGDVIEFHEELDPEYDVIASGHTHTDYITTLDGRLITQAGNYGELITKIDLRLDPTTGDVVPGSATAEQVPVTQDVTPDETVTAIVAEYRALIGTIADEVLGTVTAQVSHDRYGVAVSPLGRLIADAQLADDSVVTGGQEPVVAFMNPGGIRVPELDQAGENGATDGRITMEEAFSAQPFNNYLVSMDLTGAQIHQVLREQVSGENASEIKVLQTSTGFTYRIDDTDTPALQPGSVQIDGETVADDDSRTYRIVTNNFLAGGGDGFATLAEGGNVYFGGLDIDAFRGYLQDNSPYTPVDPDVPTVGGPIIDTGVSTPADQTGTMAVTGGVLALLAGAGVLGARRRRA